MTGTSGPRTQPRARQRLRTRLADYQRAGRDEWLHRAVLDLEAEFGLPPEAALLIVADVFGATDMTGGSSDVLGVAFAKVLPRMKAPSLCVRALFSCGPAWGAMTTRQLDCRDHIEPGMPVWRSECEAQSGDRATWFTTREDAEAHPGEHIIEGRLARGHLDAIALIDQPGADGLVPAIVAPEAEVVRAYRHPMPTACPADQFRHVASSLARAGLPSTLTTVVTN